MKTGRRRETGEIRERKRRQEEDDGKCKNVTKTKKGKIWGRRVAISDEKTKNEDRKETEDRREQRHRRKRYRRL